MAPTSPKKRFPCKYNHFLCAKTYNRPADVARHIVNIHARDELLKPSYLGQQGRTIPLIHTTDGGLLELGVDYRYIDSARRALNKLAAQHGYPEAVPPLTTSAPGLPDSTLHRDMSALYALLSDAVILPESDPLVDRNPYAYPEDGNLPTQMGYLPNIQASTQVLPACQPGSSQSVPIVINPEAYVPPATEYYNWDALLNDLTATPFLSDPTLTPTSSTGSSLDQDYDWILSPYPSTDGDDSSSLPSP